MRAWILLSALPLWARAGDVGVLVMAHGREPVWNRAVEAAVDPLTRLAPVEISFGMGAADSMQEAADRLEKRGAGRIVVVRLVIGGESFRERVEQILGLKPGAPPRPAAPEPGEPLHAMAFWRLGSSAEFVSAPDGLLESAVAGEILAERARDLSRDPAAETVLLVAHGAGHAEVDQKWLSSLETLAGAVRRDRPYSKVRAVSMREDLPETRALAEDALIKSAKEEVAAGARLILVPVNLFEPGPGHRVLSQVPHAYDGRGLLPHARVTEWIKSSASRVAVSKGWPDPFAVAPRTATGSGRARLSGGWPVVAGSTAAVGALALSRDGSSALVGSRDGTVTLWSVTQAKPLRVWRGASRSAEAVAVSRDGRGLASAGFDNVVRIWNPEAGSPSFELKGHALGIHVLSYTPDGRSLVTAGADRSVRVWDLAARAGRVLGTHEEFVRALAVSPNGRLAASGSDDAQVRLWELPSGRLRRSWKAHPRDIQALAFSPGGRLLASGGVEGSVKLWDPAGGALVRELAGHLGEVYAAAFSPDGGLLATSGEDSKVLLWNPADGSLREEAAIAPRKGSALALAFGSHGRILAGTDVGEILLFELAR